MGDLEKLRWLLADPCITVAEASRFASISSLTSNACRPHAYKFDKRDFRLDDGKYCFGRKDDRRGNASSLPVSANRFQRHFR